MPKSSAISLTFSSSWLNGLPEGSLPGEGPAIGGAGANELFDGLEECEGAVDVEDDLENDMLALVDDDTDRCLAMASEFFLV